MLTQWFHFLFPVSQQLPSHGDWPGEWRGQWESVPVPQSAGLEEYISIFEDARPSSAPHAGSRSKPAFENRNEERVQSSGAKESWRRGFTHVCGICLCFPRISSLFHLLFIYLFVLFFFLIFGLCLASVWVWVMWCALYFYFVFIEAHIYARQPTIGFKHIQWLI